MRRSTWIFLGAGLVVVGGASYLLLANRKEEIKWRSAKVEPGVITQKINATGAVSPVVQVAVGTQVSGVISALYADYNSIVKQGQLIAQIDPTVLETQLRDAQASLDRAKTAMDDAKRQLERAKRLAAEKLLADQDLEAKDVAYKTAVNSYQNAQASLERAKANRDYCDITAPVDGVVISRLADVGQTVAASFSTPNLFQIAKDLSDMKVQVSIGESDIDEVKVGQPAFFSVDSLPDKQFRARVSLVRQEPVTQSNVVNYVVEMIVPNEPLDGGDGEAGKAGASVAPAGNPGSAPGRPGKDAQAAARPGGWGGEAAPDPEKAWERMKDRLPQGTTKEEFFKRFRERMARIQSPASMPAAAAKPAANATADLQALARTPGGASLLPGPKFTGNLALRSGMTANVTIITNQKRDVLRVPNAALRFNPAAFIKDDKKEAPRAGLGQPMGMCMRQRPGGSGQAGAKGGLVLRREDRVWILENGKPKAVVVKAGITDGQFTEISGEGVTEGMQVLVGVESAGKNASSGTSVGGLSMPGGGRR